MRIDIYTEKDVRNAFMCSRCSQPTGRGNVPLCYECEADLKDEGPFVEADVIHAYTRKQAIEDGALVDVSLEAKEAGFRYPVALTRGVWIECVAWTAADAKRQARACQDERGRLWDVLSMAFHRVRHASPGESVLLFIVLRVPRSGRKTRPQPCKLKITIGPGDNAEPVLTIMLPDED